ncbi:MAG: hypothetical protein LQ350_003664 [Teloschistes chrysophthalmus]|nr:MAG: hypothetical protein LQ350_003664 [Niorma chrysophthalma]
MVYCSIKLHKIGFKEGQLTSAAGYPLTFTSKSTTSRMTGLTISLSTTFTAASWAMPSETGLGCSGNALSKSIPNPVLSRNLSSSTITLRYTAPGGWAEFIDLDLRWTSPDGSLKEEHAGKKFNNEFIKASHQANIEPCPGLYLEQWMKDAGFKDVKGEKFVWPVGTWPKDKDLKERGAWNYLQIMEGLEAFTFALFTKQLGYSKAEVEVICAKIRSEMKDPKLHIMFYLHVAYGQKPAVADTATS